MGQVGEGKKSGIKRCRRERKGIFCWIRRYQTLRPEWESGKRQNFCQGKRRVGVYGIGRAGEVESENDRQRRRKSLVVVNRVEGEPLGSRKFRAIRNGFISKVAWLKESPMMNEG